MRAMIVTWAGNYDTDAFLRQPAVRTELQELLGPELNHLMHNLNVRGSVDLNGQTLSVNGNAPHQETEEEAVVCIVLGRHGGGGRHAVKGLDHGFHPSGTIRVHEPLY